MTTQIRSLNIKSYLNSAMTSKSTQFILYPSVGEGLCHNALPLDKSAIALQRGKSVSSKAKSLCLGKKRSFTVGTNVARVLGIKIPLV